MRSLLLSLAAASCCASDLMHVPLLCRHWRESHAAAGAIVGAGMEWLMDGQDIHPVGKFIFATAAATLVGAGKEALLDKRAKGNEIVPWTLGAAAVSIAWSVKW